jgi:hypothetical protein
MSYVDVVTFGIALVGATLGVLNFWIERSRTKVRLKIIPKLCYLAGPDLWLAGSAPNSMHQAKLAAEGRRFRWAIEVINLSDFPVSISQVGFGNPKGGPDGNRCIIVVPEVSNGQKLPVRLESRQSATFYSAVGQGLLPNAIADPIAWVKTDCETVRVGTSPILRSEAARQVQKTNADSIPSAAPGSPAAPPPAADQGRR